MTEEPGAALRPKGRTPGSVRGLLGNWQSYRDGVQSQF